ncbi:MAG: hypothetical protein R3F11_24695, partial [Verrucomicrobiales bacterium]
LLWDEGLSASLVEKFFGMEWGDWASSLEVDDRITAAIRVQGWIFLALAGAVLVPIRHLAFRSLYLVATLNLIFLAWLKYHDAGMAIAQFYEHASQFLLPAILFMALGGRRWIPVAKAALAATFIGHGLYALGWTSEWMWFSHPRPGDFTEMTMICLGIESESAAENLLVVAGAVDLAAAAGLVFGAKVRSLSLSYMVVWGALTALARPWSKFDPHAAAESLFRWIPELLYRVPHFVLPLCILLALRSKKANE